MVSALLRNPVECVSLLFRAGAPRCYRVCNPRRLRAAWTPGYEGRPGFSFLRAEVWARRPCRRGDEHGRLGLGLERVERTVSRT